MISKTEYQAMTADSEETVAAAQAAAGPTWNGEERPEGQRGEGVSGRCQGYSDWLTSVACVKSAYQDAVRAMKDAATGFGARYVIVETPPSPATCGRRTKNTGKELWLIPGSILSTKAP